MTLVLFGHDLSGDTASRPTDADQGQYYYNTDTGTLQVCTGVSNPGGEPSASVWVDVGPGDTSGPATFDDGVTLGPGSDLTLDTGAATAVAGAATLNKQSGKITTESLTTPAGSDYTLTLTNSVVTANSKVFVSVDEGTNTETPVFVRQVTPAAGSVTIVVHNAGSGALNGTLKLSFLVVP